MVGVMKKYILNLIRKVCGTTHLQETVTAHLNQVQEVILSEFYRELHRELHRVHDANVKQNIMINNQISHINELQIALFNAMMNFDKDSDIYIPTMNVPPLRLRLERTSEGRICFQKPLENLSNRPPLFVITLPKSGTYLLESMLRKLSYQNAGFHAGDTLTDSRALDFNKFSDQTITYYKVSSYIQTHLVQPGQFVVGHLPFSWNEDLSFKTKICSVRELRVALVSLMRYRQKRDTSGEGWLGMDCTEEALYSFMQSGEFTYMLNVTKSIVQWVQAYPETVVLFEDLVAEDKENNASIQNLTSILNVDKDVIISALNESTGKQTLTFSGKLSSTDEIWSDRVEKIFAEHGGVELNKALGYDS